jgi:hypothetical protein
MIPEISASKVAGFIGLHKYQNPDDIFYEFLARDADGKKKIAQIQEEFHRQSYNKVVNEILKDSAIRECIQCGLSAAQRTTNVTGVLEDVQQQAVAVLALRHDNLPEELRNRLAEEVRGKVTTQRGLDNEEKILDSYEAAKKVKVTERNTKIVKRDFGTYKLVGRCDGYVAEQKRIVDSKDRTRVWPAVPLYDEIQMRCYMQLYDAVESELVERFPDKSTRNTVYSNAPEKWKYLHDLIEKNVYRLNTVLEDDEELKRIVFANTVEIVS